MTLVGKDIPLLGGGGLFPENEICFDEGDDWMVNINKDSIVFRVPINEDFLYDYSAMIRGYLKPYFEHLRMKVVTMVMGITMNSIQKNLITLKITLMMS